MLSNIKYSYYARNIRTSISISIVLIAIFSPNHTISESLLKNVQLPPFELLRIMTTSSKMIRDLVSNKQITNTTSDAWVYNTKSLPNQKSYIDKISGNLKARIYERTRDLRWGNPLNCLVTRRNKTGYNFDFQIATLIRKEHALLRRKYLEAIPMNTFPSINIRQTQFFHITNLHKTYNSRIPRSWGRCNHSFFFFF